MLTIPFHGSKKTSFKFVRAIVEKYFYNSVYEPFGGSGVLSVNLLNEGYVDTAVINDYDNFFEDYEEYLDYKDIVVRKCFEQGFRLTHSSGKLGVYYIDKDGERVSLKTSLLSEPEKKFLQNCMLDVPKRLWKKMALGANFTFPGVAQHDVIKLSDFTYFNAYVKTDKQREYLDVIKKMEVEHCDYREFLKKRSADFGYDTLLLIDPPYAGTGQGAYKSEFTEDDTFELIEILKALKIDFVFFNRDKETVEKYLDGLNIIESGAIGTGSKANSETGGNRYEYYALVSFTGR